MLLSVTAAGWLGPMLPWQMLLLPAAADAGSMAAALLLLLV
jgi:hypothetical protein